MSRITQTSSRAHLNHSGSAQKNTEPNTAPWMLENPPTTMITA